MKPATALTFAPLAFAAVLVCIVVALIAYFNQANKIITPIALDAASQSNMAGQPVSPPEQRAGSMAINAYRIRAYERALSQLSGKLQEDNYEDVIFLGGFYRDWGKWDQACDYFKNALQLAEKQGDKKGMTIALNNLGLTLYLQGQTMSGEARLKVLLESKRNLQRALTLAREVGDAKLLDTVQKNCRYHQQLSST